MSKAQRDAIVDQLRACKTTESILSYESKFNVDSTVGPLYLIVCELLRTRSISRGIAAKWLSTLMTAREKDLQSLKTD